MASTDAVINLVVNGSSKLQKAYQTLDQVSATITQLNKTPINIGAADKQVGILADAYRILLKDAKKFYDEITVGSRKAVGSTRDLYSASKNLASTTAGLRQQAAAFNDLAANIGFADKQQSKYFRSFIQGAELARGKGIRAQMEEFKALSELYTQGITPFGEKFLPGTAPMGRNALQQLIAQSAKVPNTTAALEAYGNELERTIRLVEIGSDAFRALDEAIAENARKLQSAPMQGPQPQALLGPATDLGSLKAFRQRESYQKRVNDELEKQSAIETRIAQANLFDFQKKELSLQLEEAATALAENRLTDAQRLSRELDRQRQSMERMNRAQKPQVFGALGTGFMPVTGELPSTVGPSGQRIRNLVPGSPAARLEEARAARESTQAAVALARQKQKAIEDEAEQLRKGTQAATALGKQKLKALEGEARRLRQETADAVALAQQKMREEEKAVADAWRMRGGPALPSAVEEARQVQRRGGVYRTGEFSPIDAEKRRQAILKANTRLRLKLDEIEASGVNVDIQRATLKDQVNRTISKTFDLSIKNLGAEEDALAVVSESIARIRQRNKILSEGAKGYPSSPVRGGVNIPGSPIFNETPFLERRFNRRGAAAISEGLIGGAFPLLFGQGIGAAAGGALGGGLGGFAGGGLGFGLSLVGTALGTAFDTAVQSAQELGRALEKPVENFDQLAQQSFFSSKALEDTIKKTIEYGDTATASALIQEEAIKKLGVGGVQNLKVLGTESDRLNRAFAELGQQMQAVAAGPLASVIGFFANIAGQAAAAGRVRLLRSNLDEQQAGQFNQEILQRLQQQGIQRGFFAPSAPTDAEIGMLLERGALQDIVDKWQAIEVKGRVKLDPKQKIESEINALQKRLEAMDISKGLLDQVRSANREQEDLDKQRADLARSYEESIGDIRKRIEDEVRNRRFAVLETENKILDQQGQNRINQLRLINQQFVASAGQGQRPEVEDAAKRAAQIVAQFTEQQLSAEEEAAQIKRNASLDALKFDTEAAEFKANIEKEISRLNIETARRVDDINLSVARRNEEYDQNRFKLEKRIAQLQLKNNEIITKQQLDTANKNLEAARQSKDVGQIRYAQSVANIYQAQLDIIQQGQKDIAGISAPAKLTGIPTGAVGGGGVPTGQFDAIIGQQKNRTQKLVNEILAGLDLTKATDIDSFKNQVADLAKSFNAPIVAFAQNFNDELQASSRYIELLNQGLKGTTAQQVIQLEQQRAIAIAQYNQAIASLEQKKNAKETSELAKGYIESQIVDLQIARDALLGAVSTAVKDVLLNESIIAAREAMKAMKEEMNELLDKVNQAKLASETFGNAFAGAITGSISAISGLDVMQERMTLEDEVGRLKGLRDKAKKELARQREIGKDPSIDNSEAIRQASENYSEYKKRIEEARSEMDKLGDTGRRVQEVLANMLKGIGDAFLEMAQKIIAQQVTMIIFGTILKALGIAASAGSNMSESGITEKTLAPMRQYSVLEGPGFTPSAKGSYFANGIAAFANGGTFTNSVVSSPTLFQFADGGVTRTGMMGEDGPEAVMPLERGADGKLGVRAKLDGAMARYRRPPGADAAAEPGSPEPGATGGGTAAAAPIDVRYTVERINSVDYVTADQFQAGLRQAATQGAKQGEQATLRRLQQSTATRRKLGM